MFALLTTFFLPKRSKPNQAQKVNLFITGIIVGLHWFFFFLSIKLSTVSIGVICMSSSALFTSLLGPFLNKSKIQTSELILSCFIILGIGVIFGFEVRYVSGIICGLISAFFAAYLQLKTGNIFKIKFTL